MTDMVLSCSMGTPPSKDTNVVKIENNQTNQHKQQKATIGSGNMNNTNNTDNNKPSDHPKRDECEVQRNDIQCHSLVIALKAPVLYGFLLHQMKQTSSSFAPSSMFLMNNPPNVSSPTLSFAATPSSSQTIADSKPNNGGGISTSTGSQDNKAILSSDNINLSSSDSLCSSAAYREQTNLVLTGRQTSQSSRSSSQSSPFVKVFSPCGSPTNNMDTTKQHTLGSFVLPSPALANTQQELTTKINHDNNDNIDEDEHYQNPFLKWKPMCDSFHLKQRKLLPIHSHLSALSCCGPNGVVPSSQRPKRHNNHVRLFQMKFGFPRKRNRSKYYKKNNENNEIVFFF